MFFLRYRPAIEMMLRFKNIPDKELYPDLYNDFVNMHFLQKIRKSIAVDVRKELRHVGKSENQMDLFSLYELTVRVEDENYGGNSGKKPKDKERNIIGVVVQDHCYYCDSKGHNTKTCPDKIDRKEPCAAYIKHYTEVFPKKPWVPWRDRKKNRRPAHTNMNSKKSNKKRFIALTKFSVQINDEWTKPIICIADSGGCENGINAKFARRHKMDIHTLDPSDYTDAHVQMVNGANLDFLEYVDLPCDFKGEHTLVRFFLVENLPRTLLLGCPFHDEYDAVSRIRTGEFTIHDLGVVLELFKSCRVNEHYTTIATFDVNHFMPRDSLPTPTVPMAVSQPFTYADKISYLDNFFDENVSDTNINSSFLREELGHVDNFQKIQSVFQQPANTTPPPLIAHVDIDGNWEIEVHNSPACCVIDENSDGTENDDPESGGGVPVDVQEILDTYKDRFDLSDTSPANVPVVHVPLKPEYKNRTFIGLNQKGLYVTKRLLISMARGC